VFNATFNNISVISWGSVSWLVEDTRGPGENHWQTFIQLPYDHGHERTLTSIAYLTFIWIITGTRVRSCTSSSTRVARGITDCWEIETKLYLWGSVSWLVEDTRGPGENHWQTFIQLPYDHGHERTVYDRQKCICIWICRWWRHNTKPGYQV
jgi:hypothetical protein